MKDLVPCNACCCSISSCYLDFPACIGGQDESNCLCLRTSTKWCKPVTDPKKLMICNEGGYYVTYPRTCIKGFDQFFCLESRCALPCDEEVPCMISFCFLTCFYDFKFHFAVFKSIGEIDAEVNGPPPSPETNVVQNIYIHDDQPKAAPVTVTATVVSPASSNPEPSSPPPPPPSSSAPSTSEKPSEDAHPPSVPPPPPAPAAPHVAQDEEEKE